MLTKLCYGFDYRVVLGPLKVEEWQTVLIPCCPTQVTLCSQWGHQRPGVIIKDPLLLFEKIRVVILLVGFSLSSHRNGYPTLLRSVM